MCLVSFLLLMSPHDGGSHDEETNIDHYDDYHWNNECPNEVGARVQKTPEGGKDGICF